jgi:hypothetical protein
MKKKTKLLPLVLLLCFIWLAISIQIQRAFCPQMTETELFINAPKSFVGNWAKCK